MAISNDIEVVIGRYGGTYEEFDLPSRSNDRHHSRKLIHVPSGGKYKILLGLNKDCARDNGYAFDIYHGRRLKATAVLDFPRVKGSKEDLVRVPENHREPYLFPSHDPRRSGDDQSVIRVEVKHFKVTHSGVRKFLSRGHYVFTGNQLPGTVTDDRPLAEFEFVLGNTIYLPIPQAIDPVRNHVAAAPASMAQVKQQIFDATTATGRNEFTKQDRNEVVRDEASHHQLDSERNSVKQLQQSTVPETHPRPPTSKLAAIFGTITGADAPDEHTGLGKGFGDEFPDLIQPPEGLDSAARSGLDNGDGGHTVEALLAPRHENDIGKKIKALFDHITRDDAKYDFICNICELRFEWGSRKTHYRTQHQTEPLRPVDEDRKWHKFKGVNALEYAEQAYLDKLKVPPLKNNVEFKCHVCHEWLWAGCRAEHYHKQHKQLLPKLTNEEFRLSPTCEALDATKLVFEKGNYGLQLPKPHDYFRLVPASPAPAVLHLIGPVANTGAPVASRNAEADHGMPPPPRPPAPPLNSPASVARRANAVAGSRAGTVASRTITAAADMPNTRTDRDDRTTTAPVRRNTINAGHRSHLYVESISSAQSARSATRVDGSSADSQARKAGDRGSERSEHRNSARRL